MTGHLERPSQEAPETRKAAEERKHFRSQRSPTASMRALDRAEMDLLIASQRAARRNALAGVDAALGARHASAIVAVVTRFAAQRASLDTLDAGARAAIVRRLADEEANELVNLALAHAIEKRASKRAAAKAMLPAQKSARQALQQSARRRRITMAVAPFSREISSRVCTHKMPSRSPAQFSVPRRR